MSTVFLVVVGLVVVVGLITTLMSAKSWHWAQMLLLLGVFLSSLGTLVLGMEVYRIHRNLRKGLPAIQQQLADVQAENEALRYGARDATLATKIFAPEEVPFDFEAENRMPGIDVWTARLQLMARERGRVWRGVRPGGPVDPRTNRVAVAIPQPRPHGLEKESIVFLFEEGEPNAAAPANGPQYLGEFRVADANAEGALLQSVTGLDQITGPRLVRSAQNPNVRWSLYETMPADRHELFAGLTEEQLKQMLPAASVNEYLRQGTPATDDDDEFHRAGFDDTKQRVGPENADKAVEWRYDRTLRDYPYLFGELIRQRVVMLADRAALREDVGKLKAAKANADKLAAHRTKEKGLLTKDSQMIERERKFIEQLRDKVAGHLAQAKELIAQLLQENRSLADQYAQRQLESLEAANAAAPGPVSITSPLLNSTP